jgi:hypothetical protein
LRASGYGLSLCDLFRIPDFVDLGTALAVEDDCNRNAHKDSYGTAATTAD